MVGMLAPTNPNKRVLLVDDHPILRSGLRLVIESQKDLSVCGEADGEREARMAIKELSPDAVIADISMKQGDGIEFVRDIRAQYPKLLVLVFSGHDEAIYAERMLAAGANGYIMKRANPATFIGALRHVLSGGIFVSEVIGNSLSQCVAPAESDAANPIDRLSNREVQILHMIGLGMSTRETALSLSLSIKTVESHRQRIKRKLHLNNATQLVQCAVNWFGNAGREPPSTTRRHFDLLEGVTS
jgi:DNA-binding NarL/FixJ family response regulator